MPNFSSLSRPHPLVGALLLSVSACHGADCFRGPCPIPVALNVTVTSAAAGVSITNATISVTGAVLTSFPCTGGVCFVTGYAGTYEVDISAPGYQSVHRQVVVQGSNPECGCASTRTQQLAVALANAN
jgi:hypothetical protein